MSRGNRLWSPDFVLVLSISLLAFITCQGLNNGTPIYVSFAGGNNAYAGALILEFSIAAAVARILVGGRIDALSRRLAMMAGAGLLLVGTLGVVVVPALGSQVVFRAVQGLGFGTVTTAASTAAADIVPSERLGEGLGYYGLGQSLGMAIGPSLAIVLVSFAYHETLFVGMALLCACLIVLAFSCGYERHPERLAETSAYRVEREAGSKRRGGPASKPERANAALASLFEKAALPGALPMLISCLGYSAIVNFVSKFGVQQGLQAPGVFFVCAALTMTAVRLGGGRFIDRLAPIRVLFVPIACGVACLAILAVSPGEPWFYFAGALFGLSMGLAFPLYNTVAVRCSPTGRRGAASALYLLANDVGIGVGAVIWGAVIDVMGYVASFWGAAGMLVVAFATAWFAFPRN